MNYAYYQALAQGRLTEYLLEWEEEHSETEEDVEVAGLEDAVTPDDERDDVDRVAVPGESGSESERATGNQTRAAGHGSFLKRPDAVSGRVEVEMGHGDAGVNHLESRVRRHVEADGGAVGRRSHAPRLAVGSAGREPHEREHSGQWSVDGVGPGEVSLEKQLLKGTPSCGMDSGAEHAVNQRPPLCGISDGHDSLDSCAGGQGRALKGSRAECAADPACRHPHGCRGQYGPLHAIAGGGESGVVGSVADNQSQIVRRAADDAIRRPEVRRDGAHRSDSDLRTVKLRPVCRNPCCQSTDVGAAGAVIRPDRMAVRDGPYQSVACDVLSVHNLQI